jgi:hypothetical protein
MHFIASLYQIALIMHILGDKMKNRGKSRKMRHLGKTNNARYNIPQSSKILIFNVA